MKKVIVRLALSIAIIVCSGQIAVSQTVSFGAFAGTGGNQNSIFGYGAAFGITGDANTVIGYNAGSSITTATQNTFIGHKAGYSNSTSIQNHFVGYQSGYSNTIGYLNHFEGHNSGYSNITGSENQFVGLGAGYSNASGNGNLFIGYIAGRENTIASFNQFIGNRAGWKNTTGSQNYFTGYQAGYNNTTGSNNYFSGFRSGFSNVTGSGNVFLGNNSGYYETGSNKLYVDNSDTSEPLLYGDFGTNQLAVNGNLSIGTTSSVSKLNVNGDIQIANAYIPMGLMTEVGGATPLLNMSVNFREPNKNTTYRGAGFRIDTRNDFPLFQWISRQPGSTNELQLMTLSESGYLQVQNAYCDGNTWYNVSDRNMKENFARIKANESILDKVLELPIQYWNYKGDNGNRHIGPTAQDFYNTFKLGKNEKAISTIDESGVALAAIQELAKETRELKKMVEEQQQVIASLMQNKVESIGAHETGLKLHQNQPNPFQRDTRITMEIPHEINKADLYIYDLSGRIARQHNVPGRGITSITIEGGALNSGMYLYVLIGDGKATEAKRMILTE